MPFVTKSYGKSESYKTNDIVYTPRYLAKLIIDQLPIQENDILLDPFKGGGAFYDQFPETQEKDWCEIEEGRDFFDYNKRVDWIISNPPYSKYTEVMQHSYELANNVVYLIPLNKIVSSWGRCVDLENYGGIPYIWIFPAAKANFSFGFPACAVWIKQGYRGLTKTILWKNLQQPKDE